MASTDRPTLAQRDVLRFSSTLTGAALDAVLAACRKRGWLDRTNWPTEAVRKAARLRTPRP
jgi:hypothetical protein